MFTHLIDPPPAAHADAVSRFMHLLRVAWAEGGVRQLLLGKYCGADDTLQRLIAREVHLRGERQWSFVWRHRAKDVTSNFAANDGLARIAELLGRKFQHAHLQTRTQDIQLAFSRKGKALLRVGALTVNSTAASAEPPALSTAHDRVKRRLLSQDSAYWLDLGLTHDVKGSRAVVPALSRKWKQINKFIEVLSAALHGSALLEQTNGAEDADLHVADFGCGKGYLTFAMHEWLGAQGRRARVTGVELRQDLVALCEGVAQRHALAGLAFEQGDVRSATPQPLDVVVALHACDTATDHALHLGMRSGASVIVCSPCCHKEIRPQMHTPLVLQPLLRHGIHLGQQAEMVTDALRALLLEAQGYATQVFEFVALEHTSKNKMILAVRQRGDALAAAQQRRGDVMAQIDAIKAFYGLREQCLERLIGDDAARVGAH